MAKPPAAGCLAYPGIQVEHVAPTWDAFGDVRRILATGAGVTPITVGMWKDPPLIGTRFEFAAPRMSPGERRADVDEMARMIRDMVAEQLSLTASALVVEPHVRIRDRLIHLLRSGSCPIPVSEYRPWDPQAQLPAEPDPWLVVIAVDAQSYDPLPVVDRMLGRFPYAMVVGRSGGVALRERGPYFDAGLEVIASERELARSLDSIAAYTQLRRATLYDRIVRELLGRQVVHRFGPEAAASLGFYVPSGHCPTLEELETSALKRALIIAKGSRTRAAQLLGISRSSLYQRLGMRGLSAFAKK